MKRPYYPKPKSFNVAEQLAALARLYPGSDGKVRGDELVFQAELSPTPFSRTYVVRVSYREGHYPETVVVNPKLRSLAGERKIPHVYRGDMDPLCLFYAKGREWTPQQMIANTIIPWTCEWLLHFEAWLYTNVWEGGGIEHGSSPIAPLAL